MEDLPDRGAALDAGREGVFGQLLHHVEDVPVLTLVLVDRHPASNFGAREPRLYRLDRLPVLSARTLARVEFPRAEVLPQVLARGLDELGFGADLLYLQGRSVAPHVLLLYHVPRCAPSPTRWMMYSMTLSSRAEGLLRPNNLSQKDLLLSSGTRVLLVPGPKTPAYTNSITTGRKPPQKGLYARACAPTSASAIWTAFVAAPLSRLSATHQYWITRPSTRTRPT